MDIDKLKKIQGKHTVETISYLLNLSRQSTINLISKLKKEGYLIAKGGGHQKRIYMISTKKQIKKKYDGMFDILNKYSPDKVVPYYEHIPHYKYFVEDAIVDLACFDDIRILVNMLPLFNHVNSWSRLYLLAKEKKVRKKVGALYDLAREFTKVRKIPNKTRDLMLKSSDKFSFKSSSGDFLDIEKLWGVKIPFNKNDLEVYKK